MLASPSFCFNGNSNKDDLFRDNLKSADLLVFGGPHEPFHNTEFQDLKSWLQQDGGRALILLYDGGESQSNCNINHILEE
jgi:hypothetical protein